MAHSRAMDKNRGGLLHWSAFGWHRPAESTGEAAGKMRIAGNDASMARGLAHALRRTGHAADRAGKRPESPLNRRIR